MWLITTRMLRPVPIRENKQAWEDWGRVDPLWAVLTEPSARGNRWNIEEFFASGASVVAAVFADAAKHGLPAERLTAIDFGCGVGRLTRALAGHVEHVVGLDIAQSMVDEAKRLNAGVDRCEFRVQHTDDLRAFADGSVDVVLTLLVLQHIPAMTAIERYLAEFVRVLAPGGLLAFQLPTHIPAPAPPSLRARLRPRTRAAAALRRLGVSPRWLHRRLGWSPAMPMTAIPSDRVAQIIDAAGGTIVASHQTAPDHGGVESRYYYVTC